ncbi:MAG: hypothetical protein H7Y17_01365 [Chlorobia bacterium]|nr:hypothetical protein [Fimbriimonadaceae bacterium]
MVSLLFAAISLTQQAPTVAVKGGGILPIRSFEVGTSDDLVKLKGSKADLLIVRFKKWGPKPEESAKALQKGPNGRRVVLVEFPALGANPNNILLWR